MAVIEYQCDVCNRIINLPQNKKGIEIIQKCIITDKCRGELHSIGVKLDHLRGNFPDRVASLNDYKQRQSLYNHTQAVKLEVWEIKHNLGVIPSLQVFVERPKDIDLNSIDINIIDPNTLIEHVELSPSKIETINGNITHIHFEQPEKGYAQLIAKSTRHKQVKDVTTIKNNIPNIQITNNSELTIATLNDNPVVTLIFDFISSSGNVTEIVYVVDNASIISAWSDYDKVFIKGRKYVVRSFNFYDGQTVFGNEIPDGSTITLKQIDGVDIEAEQVLVLLSSAPFNVIDKIKDSYIDLGLIKDEKYSVIYEKGDLQVERTYVSLVYPHIIKIQ